MMVPDSGPQCPTILMVDDNLEMLEEYRELLECDGLIATICDCPARAIDLLRDSPTISVVLTDLRMDGMSGTTMIEKMRTTVPDRQLSFALVTGATELGPELPNAEVRVLFKPVEPDQLVAMILEMLKQ